MQVGYTSKTTAAVVVIVVAAFSTVNSGLAHESRDLPIERPRRCLPIGHTTFARRAGLCTTINGFIITTPNAGCIRVCCYLLSPQPILSAISTDLPQGLHRPTLDRPAISRFGLCLSVFGRLLGDSRRRWKAPYRTDQRSIC